MGTTPTYSWPYPEDTDPVANGAQDIEDLALAVETTVSGLTQKIQQVVRATDTNVFTTSSTSPTDVTGVSVTITPTSATSSILLVLTGRAAVQNATNNDLRGWFYITDSSNNTISGAEASTFGTYNLSGSGTKRARQTGALAVAWATPATTSATTYKVRASVIDANATIYLDGGSQTTQMFAIEVSA